MRAMKLGPYKSGDLTFDGAVKYATKKTGYSDFGDDEFNFAKTYKTVLSNPIQSIQQYTNLGYISARIELNMTMVRRLRFIQYLKDVPEVQHVRVHSPVFVMGLPRTGTTLLHRLLSLDTKEVRESRIMNYESCKGYVSCLEGYISVTTIVVVFLLIAGCITKNWSSSKIPCNNTSIACKHHTDNSMLHYISTPK